MARYDLKRVYEAMPQEWESEEEIRDRVSNVIGTKKTLVGKLRIKLGIESRGLSDVEFYSCLSRLESLGLVKSRPVENDGTDDSSKREYRQVSGPAAHQSIIGLTFLEYSRKNPREAKYLR